MRSFATLSLLVSLVFSGLSSAHPTQDSLPPSSSSVMLIQAAGVVKTGDINLSIANHKFTRDVTQDAGVVKTGDIKVIALNHKFTRDVSQDAGVVKTGDIKVSVANHKFARDVSQDAGVVKIDGVDVDILNHGHTLRDVEQVADVVRTGDIKVSVANHQVTRDVSQDATVIKIDDIKLDILNHGNRPRDAEQEATGVNANADTVVNYSTMSAVSGKIAPLCKKLGTLAAADVTVSVVTPIVDEIKLVLVRAAIEVEALREQPVEYVLWYGGAVISIQAMGEIVAALIVLIYTAIAGVLSVVAAAQLSLILPSCVVLAHLLFVVFIQVTGLQAVVLVLIYDIVPAILDVDCTSLIAVLGINIPL
ncbi:hypothetical protein BD779DRAFT_1729973 [Infundibulicybe gibba]|nr:hypothetical protein BD779DRAFT_1729973 [Infundibulicybe gibba]